MGAWSNDDPQSAGQWLTQLEGDGRDVAVDAYSAATTSTNPATAMQWAETIAEPSLRQRVMNRVASIWRANDVDAMVAWIQSSGLPQNEQASLLSAGSAP
jgi:O-acetylhomoserine/O-acetylserine sulfhydrylase-like pyridoxal-dependent enzyme